MDTPNYKYYTNITEFRDKLGVRVRDPETRQALFYNVAYQPRTFSRGNPKHAEWYTLDGYPLIEKRHSTCGDYRDYVREREKQNITLFGTIDPTVQFMAEYVPRDCGVPFHLLRVCYMDIEVESEQGFAPPEDPYQPITAITCEVDGHYYVWGLGDYTVAEGAPITYVKCDSEEALIKSWVQWWVSDYPDVITGWNIGGYDVPYMYYRIERLREEGRLKFSARILSPWRKIGKRNFQAKGQDLEFLDLQGVAILDYMELYKKHSMTMKESYRLDSVAKAELGIQKVAYDEYGSLARLARENYQKFIDYNIQDVSIVRQLNDKLHYLDLVVTLAYGGRINYSDTFKQVRMWDATMYYSLYDRNIVVPSKVRREKGEKFPGAYVKDPKAGLYGWVASFDVNSLYPSIMREWNISPDRHLPIEWIKQRLADIELEHGDYEEAPADQTPREWRANVAKADAKAVVWALRRLIEQLETFDVDTSLRELASDKTGLYPWLRVLGVCITPWKQVFRSDSEGFLPGILSTLYVERSKFKKLAVQRAKEAEQTDDPAEAKRLKAESAQYDVQQNIRKINLNSCYGAVGNEHFRFFDVRHAASVTISGQMIIRHVANEINKFMNQGGNKDYVAYADTDSVYVQLTDVLNAAPTPLTTTKEKVDYLDQWCEKVAQPIIDKAFARIHEELNTLSPVLAMKREVIAESALWAAKKRYMLWMHDKEGARYEKPKLKITGLEVVRSSTPTVAQKMIRTALELFIQNKKDEFYKHINESEERFYSLPFNDVASPRSCNGLDKYIPDADGNFASKTPIHVKGAIVYNRHLEATGLSHKYERIKKGEKVKFIDLKPGNPMRALVVAAPHVLPPEWKMEEWIDKKTQFEKVVLNPVEKIISFAKWPIKPTFTFDSFF